MKISIIIPSLNEEKLLPKLLGQLNSDEVRTSFDFEIIVSDGGSSDKTFEFAEEKADKIVRFYEDRKQKIAEGRNTGAKEAVGEVLLFTNADVLFDDPMKLFREIENNFIDDKYIAMTCDVEIFPDERKMIDTLFMGFYNYYFHFLNIIGLGMGRGECQVVRKSTFNELEGYNEKLTAGEDFEFFTRLRKQGQILFSHRVKVYESPRRYRKYGHWRIFFTWLINSIYVMFGEKSHSKDWKEVR